MKIYLAGPMRGYENFNFPAFYAAAVTLRGRGHEVFSPAEKDIEKYGNKLMNKAGDEAEAASNVGFSLRDALRMDLEWICSEGDAIALLKGWERSSGANAEYMTARALGQQFMFEYDGFMRIFRAEEMPVLFNITMNPEYTWRKTDAAA